MLSGNVDARTGEVGSFPAAAAYSAPNLTSAHVEFTGARNDGPPLIAYQAPQGHESMMPAKTASSLGGPTPPVPATSAIPQAPVAIEIPSPERVEVPEGGVSLPMQDVGGRPMVDVTLNGRGPYPFILDTGASVTTVAADLIADLGLRPAPGMPSPGPVRVDELRVGGASMYGVIVGRDTLLGNFSGPNPPKGVLSASYFPGSLVTLDYPKRRVTIRRGALPSPDNRQVFRYAAEDILPRVPLTIAGHEFRPHVDSGSPSGLMLPMKAAGDLPLADTPTQVGRAVTGAGEFPVFMATLTAPVTLGEYTLDVTQLRFSDLRPGPAPGVGTMGYLVLKGFAITLDSANHRLKFERASPAHMARFPRPN